MEAIQDVTDRATLQVENIGGISETEVELEPGVTTLVGRNATNRTSLLQAIMGALGSDAVTLHSGADSGSVELTIGDDTYTRTLTRRNDTVTTGGDPYLEGDDARSADLFAFLHESNEARRAVEQGDDLREILMEPVDTDEIEAEIDRLVAERSAIDDQIDEVEDLAERLPGLEERRASLRSQIEETEAELAEKREALEEIDGTVEARRENRSDLDEAISDLESARNELERVKRDRQTERRSVDSLEDELEELEAELESLPAGSDRSLEEIDRELSRLREQERSAKTELNQLQSIVQFNEEMLEDGGLPAIEAAEEADATTDKLLPESEQEVACWTCGTVVERDAIEETVDRLRSLRQSKMSRLNEVSDEIDELEETKSQLSTRQRERQRLERRIESTESELEERRERIEELEERRTDLENEVESLEADVEELNQEENDELLELNREVNRLEFDLGDLENQLAEVDDEIEQIESQVDERDDLTTKREEIGEEITELRTRVERIERDAVEAFNDHMAELLDLLGYENIDRIWIEQVEREVREGRRTVSKSAFDLHIIRSGDGTVHEDAVEHLSESEREVTGLVFALAGYLVHDLHQTVPFMLLDSLEAIDSDRIAALLEYFAEYADFLVVALLTEDARAVEIEHHTVADI